MFGWCGNVSADLAESLQNDRKHVGIIPLCQFQCTESLDAELQLESRSTLTAASTGVGHWREPGCTKCHGVMAPHSYRQALHAENWHSKWTKIGTSTRWFHPLKTNFASLPCLYGKSKSRNGSLSSWSWYAKCPNTKVNKKQPKSSLHPKQDTSFHMLLCREEAERKSQSFLSTLLEAAQILWWWVW